ncbi:MAG: Na+/H+ antiporter subunit E [Planctomycetes bacterium]|nr:Na+/H+ antiporter subunit E [Planctomycetota bacterium]
MTAFLWNLVLALVWAFAQSRFTVAGLVVGFLLGYAILCLGRGPLGSADYCARLPRLLKFLAFFLWEMLLANLRVGWDVLTPRHRMKPGIVALPLDAATEGEITLLACLITLTPGTLALDVSSDRRFLYVHCMYIDDAQRVKRHLKSGIERRLLEILR